MKRTSLEEFTNFVRENLKFNQLAYHNAYVKYSARSNYEKRQLKEMYDLVKESLRKTERIKDDKG